MKAEPCPSAYSGAAAAPSWLRADVSRNMKKALIILLPLLTFVAGFFLGISFEKEKNKSEGLFCNNQLRQIEAAKDQYALENGLTNGSVITWEQIERPSAGYLKAKVRCPAGGDYTINVIGQNDTCSLGNPNTQGEKSSWHRLP